MAAEPIYKTIGSIIRAKRRGIDWSQERLADHLGLSRATLANIELGRQRILVHQLYALADVLQMTPVDLLPPITEADNSSNLPLPADLNPQQRAQVVSLIDQVPTSPTMEDRTNGPSPKQLARRRSK